MTKGSERTYILKILEDMESKSLYPSQVLDDYFYVYDFDKQQRSFIAKVVFGMLEQQYYIDYAINKVSKVQVSKMKPLIRHVMRMSAYQILFMDKVPDHGAINEAVKLVKKRKFHQLGGFVNGVLRALTREKEAIAGEVAGLPSELRLSVLYSVHKEMIVHLKEQYGLDVIESFLKESMKEKKTVLRRNAFKSESGFFITELEKEAVVKESPLLRDSYRISGYDSLASMETFKRGLFQVQDESSTLVGLSAGIKPGMRVLDTCCAPGGKTTHIAELLKGEGELIACDISEHKLQKVEDNLKRLDIEGVSLRIMDAATKEDSFVDGFDVVICDAPCSGLGILRSKPDIKLNMDVPKMEQLVHLQEKILSNVQAYVKPGGTLVYSTCTVNRNENIHQVESFLKEHPDFEIESLKPVFDQADEVVDASLLDPYYEQGCLQLLTQEKLTDGFFICRMHRKAK